MRCTATPRCVPQDKRFNQIVVFEKYCEGEGIVVAIYEWGGLKTIGFQEKKDLGSATTEVKN